MWRVDDALDGRPRGQLLPRRLPPGNLVEGKRQVHFRVFRPPKCQLIEFMPESGRVYLYILVKKDMAVEVIDAALNAPAYISEDYNTIPGYKIVRPNSKIGGKVYIRIKPAE